MKTTTTIKYPFYKMDADLQQAIIDSLARDIELHEEDGEYNPEDNAISRLAGAVFIISNEPLVVIPLAC